MHNLASIHSPMHAACRFLCSIECMIIIISVLLSPVNPEVSCNLDCGNGQCFLVQGVGQCACDFGYVVDGSGVCLIGE